MYTEEKVMTPEEQQVETPKTEPSQTPPDAERKVEHSWVEEIELAGDQVVNRVKELIAEGNVRRLIIRGSDNKELIQIPLTAGVAVGGVFTIFAPVLAALGALAALIAKVKIEIVRVDGGTEK